MPFRLDKLSVYPWGVGHDLRIARGNDRTRAQSAAIPIEEWSGLIRSDPEVRRDHFARSATPEGILRHKNRGLAVSKAYSGNETDGNFAWFDHRNGCVIVKSPDEEILGKMKQIAETLRAGASGTLAKNNID